MDLNDAVDNFNVEVFLEQLSETAAAWVIFTVGQNTGFYAAPNRYLSSISGKGHCADRDLILEIATGLRKMGKRLIAYIPGEVNSSKSLHDAFQWNPSDQSKFQRRYTDFLRTYSDQWGQECAGWWIDGCYDWPQFPNRDRDWALWCGALRSGNAESALAFNDGAFLNGIPHQLSPDQDFLSGEANGLSMGGPVRISNKAKIQVPLTDKLIRGIRCVPHVVCPIDNLGQWVHTWGGEIGPPLYTEAEMRAIMRQYFSFGFGITMNVGIYQEGYLGKRTFEFLKKI